MQKAIPVPDNCVKKRYPGRNTLSPTLYGSLDSYFTHFISPDVNFSYMLNTGSILCGLLSQGKHHQQEYLKKEKSVRKKSVTILIYCSLGFAFVQIFKCI